MSTLITCFSFFGDRSMPKLKRQSLDQRRRLAKLRLREIRKKLKSNSKPMAATEQGRKIQPQMYRIEQRKEYRTLNGENFEITRLYMYQLLAPS